VHKDGIGGAALWDSYAKPLGDMLILYAPFATLCRRPPGRAWTMTLMILLQVLAQIGVAIGLIVACLTLGVWRAKP
jgi:hypothetical protein